MNKPVIIITVLATMLAGCGRKPVRDTGEFESLVQQFEALSASEGTPVHVSDLIIKFGPTSLPTELAVCVRSECKQLVFGKTYCSCSSCECRCK